jgi:hypothetical protein
MRFAAKKTTATLIVTAVIMAGAPARGGDVPLIYDFFSPYFQRYDGIMPGAGDAEAVNTATQMIDPWPPNVGNRHIPGDGERMANAVRRYRDVSKLPCAPAPLAPVQIEMTGLTGGGGGPSATGATGGSDCNSSSGVSANVSGAGNAGAGGVSTLTAPSR